MEEACPTCGQRLRPTERRLSDFDRGMDFWAARDAYQATGVLGLLAAVLAVGTVLWVIGTIGEWLGY